jgi:hypothetical protein
MHVKELLFIAFIFFVLPVFAQDTWRKDPVWVDPPVCYASGEVRRSAVPPPPEFLNRLKSAGSRANIEVIYLNFPDSVKPAFEYAVSIWESLISSPVTIYLQARWQSMAGNVLASCGPSNYYANFHGAPLPDVYYPVALVEKLQEEQLTGRNVPDIQATFNSTISWYLGTDMNTPADKYDFVSTVLHEIAHGLGFTGFFEADVAKKTGSYGFRNRLPAVFDTFVQDLQFNHLCDHEHYANPSASLYNAFISDRLYSGSYLGSLWNKSARPRLYAPSTFNDGSSIYHLNSSTYFYGNINSLMTHAAGKGEAIHTPGPITLGILSDMGWRHLFIRHDPPGDIEIIKEPLRFDVVIDSDMGLDTSNFNLVYSYDNFLQHKDSLDFAYNTEAEIFSGFLTPGIVSGTIYYYIQANDSTGRTFRSPNAPGVMVYTINIGTDAIPPVIAHRPPAYLLWTEKEFVIEASVTDNILVDTVFVRLSIDGIEQEPKGMLKSGPDLYSYVVPIAGTSLRNGGIIEYVIVAVDGSLSRNTSTLPEEGRFTVAVENLLDPVNGYFTNFDDAENDFITGDFTITRKTGFDSNALFSPNPYPSPEESNRFYDFMTILRYPIIVKHDGRVSFDEVVLVEPGENGSVFGDDQFWDYVIVEGSSDFGNTWLPLVDGYDSKEQATWLTVYNSEFSDDGMNSVANGTMEYYIGREFSLTANGNFKEGDIVVIRFRLFSDPFANGWGWVIDNLRIQQPLTASGSLTLSPGHLMLWPNPFSSAVQWSFTGSEPAGDLMFEFIDISGRVLKKEKIEGVFPGMQASISTHDLPRGLFIISVTTQGIPVRRIKMNKH